ncbi:hypothetical protein GJW-30_1_03535 [Variibacter gotjawalensis]|jgi:hypothetical protein|uniref:YARHG domain-containing protein n=1 Tax=Variibacter gotjawalensis TaxID=1333996 RepID=A0A0S3PYH2_9BRAD|nr:YARHG domain-containing protein [Variibacter gotjawalensis]NIK46822.1 hypothetical protein [Variibacter gotjawalensis]RZS48726.1 YARHG domain-containing protein [Variibacter gotjawalensis]BAT60985.1 hypothetical protein GJW-30_1_03535 [Variibacter gotjawalensis]
MTRLLLCALAASSLISLLAPPARAQDPCDDLWLERNSIYKRAGYCFKTARAIRQFGNAGCQYDDERDLPMSQRDRNRVAYIVQQERAYGCR